ncbi:MAG: hypothetical protein WCL45_10400, partial [Polynucleobacter sp.]
ISGDTVGIATGGSGSVSSPNVAAGSQTLSLGTLALSNNSGGNYTLVGGSGTAIITPATLVLTGSQIYNAGTAFAGSNLVANGVNGETFAVTGSGSSGNLVSPNVQTGSVLSTTMGLSLGSSNNGGIAGNYNALGPVCSVVSVTPAPLGITVTGTYTGLNTITPSAFTKNGLQGGDSIDSISSATVYNPNVSANSYNYVTGITIGSGTASMSNYALSVAYNATTGDTQNKATINPAPLAISVNATYNGTNSFTKDNAIIDVAGMVNKETLVVTGVNTYSSNVGDNGTNYVTSITSIAGSSTASLSNYAINSGYRAVSGTLVAGATANTSPNAVTLSAAALVLDIGASKTYDGTTNFYVTPGSLASNFDYGFIGTVGSDAPYITGGSAQVSSANRGTYSKFFNNTLTLSDPNYTLTGGAVIALITQAPLTIVGAKTSLVYTGSQQTNSSATVYGVVGGQSITVDPAAYAKATNVAQGIQNDAAYTLIYSGGASANNYKVTSTDKGSLTITAAPLNVVGANNK